VTLQARNKQVEGTETIKVRYGPYKIPGVNTKNALGEGGTLFNYPEVKVQKSVYRSVGVEKWLTIEGHARETAWFSVSMLD
jgi:hypothetical protein